MRAEPTILVVEENPGDARLYEKALLRARRVPVIVSTASDAESDVARSYAGHASWFLRKPIDLDQLLGTLDAAASFWLTAALLPSRR
jgi:CheY-like chemotaxis protein